MLCHITGSAKQCQNPKIQYFQLKRLHNIVIRTVSKTRNNIRTISADSKKNNGKLLPVPANPPTQILPMSVRHVPVQQNKSWNMLHECLPCLCKCGTDCHLKVFLFQIFLYNPCNTRIIFNIIQIDHDSSPSFLTTTSLILFVHAR